MTTPRTVPAVGAKAADLPKSGPILYVRRTPLTTVEDVRAALQQAIELEHATLPVYLQAAYSLDETKNAEIVSMITGVVMQEMEHFCQAANILVAIGGKPAIDNPAFVPTYPGGLPKGIGSQPGQPPFIVHLRGFSLDQVENCFMVIEEPADPLDIKESALRAAPSDIAENYRTIGEFYDAIAAALKALGDGVFSHSRDWQVYGMFGTKPILGLEDALQAIERIVREGEGTPTSPMEGEVGATTAHYYSFYEIWKGRKIGKNAAGEWVFTDALVPFDPTGVQDLIDDPKQADYPPGSNVAIQSRAFNTYYSDMLKALHAAFNGNPGKINHAIGLMFDIKIQAKQLMAMTLDNGKHAAPTWEYVA
ncbi:hypothetical protein AZL_b02340 (plasmid) [Azospirillum sp. B510]|uniref:ferritin-like domain-containing protein n=1 Tax=Azospirillum sp. (strain B510) TaxID=137722 RepID=UPI0001C4CC8B|nr:ferritin-like protein [Azospirillum sp. B510]BAI74897.1 hypothetical protein AZL_b02340 [Azospirillum sp. B510]